jgi:hypothetical protein
MTAFPDGDKAIRHRNDIGADKNAESGHAETRIFFILISVPISPTVLCIVIIAPFLIGPISSGEAYCLQRQQNGAAYRVLAMELTGPSRDACIYIASPTDGF